MNSIYKTILIIIISSLFCCCSSKDISYYEDGSVKEERFSKWNNSDPLLIKRYYQSGKIKEILNYNKLGYLDNFVKIEINGDSIVDQFTNNEEKLLRRIYTKKNELIKQPYVAGKMTGVSYYYKDKILLKRLLVVEDSILACEITEKIDKDKIIKISPEGANNEQVIPAVYKNYKFATTQYINLSEEGFSPVGIYLSNDYSTFPDSSVSSFVYMDLPDTVNCSETITGKVFGNYWGKDGVYLKVYLFNLDEAPKEGVFHKKMKSIQGRLDVDFELAIEEPGYHFLCGYAYLMKNDSTQIQNYIIYDDVYAVLR